MSAVEYIKREHAESPYRGKAIRLAATAEQSRELAVEARTDPAEVIAAMRALKDAPVNHSGHIDHTPGGSPEAFTDPAPAPRHEWRRPERFSAFRREAAPSGRVSMAELGSRAYAAARQALQGKQWSEDQRLDAASAVVEAVLRRENVGAPRHGTPREVLAWIDFCGRFPHEAARRERANVATVAREAASGLALYRLASNERRAMERADGRMEEATHAAFTAEVQTADAGTQLRRERDLLATPRKARLTAVHMLADLDLDTSWGPLLTVAYTAARAPWTRGEDGKLAPIAGDDIAAELELTHTAYRKQMGRGRKLIAENVASERWMAESLHVLDPLAGSGGALHAAKLIADWRGLDKAPPTPSAPTLTVSRKRTGAPRRTPAEWTLKLPDRTRNRLHALATARQERAGLAPEKRTRSNL